MSAQRRKIARRLEKSPLLKRELSEMAVESYGDAVLSAARETGLDEKRIAGANQQNSLSVTAGKGSNLWARSFLTCTNPAALTCLLNVLVHLT